MVASPIIIYFRFTQHLLFSFDLCMVRLTWGSGTSPSLPACETAAYLARIGATCTKKHQKHCHGCQWDCLSGFCCTLRSRLPPKKIQEEKRERKKKERKKKFHSEQLATLQIHANSEMIFARYLCYSGPKKKNWALKQRVAMALILRLVICNFCTFKLICLKVTIF